MNLKRTSYFNLKEYYEAIDCFDKALQIDPKFKSAWNNKGAACDNLTEF